MKLSILFAALLATGALAQKKTVTVTKTKTRKPVTKSVTITTTATDISTVSTTATETVSTTATVTTTVSSTNPRPTDFNGSGYLYVFPEGGARKGCLISGGNWYAGGGSCATYKAVRTDGDRSTFNLTTSKGPCVISANDSGFTCAAANTVGTLFSQNGDGNLTYLDTEVFYAAATATGTTQQPVFATSKPVAFDVTWFSLS